MVASCPFVGRPSLRIPDAQQAEAQTEIVAYEYGEAP